MGNTLHTTVYWHLQAQTPPKFRLSLISVRDAAHPPAAPLPIASDQSFHPTQHPLFDSSIGSYTPDSMVAHNGLDGFANYFSLLDTS